MPLPLMRGCCPGTVVLCVTWEQVLAMCNVTNPSAPGTRALVQAQGQY